MSTILDTRDLAERKDELVSMRDDYVESARSYAEENGVDFDEDAATEAWRAENEEDAEELKALQELESEVTEWRDGNALIPEDEFTDYARQLAEDIGAIERDMAWPCNFIDWDAAANSLKADYSTCEFQGTTYYYRA